MTPNILCEIDLLFRQHIRLFLILSRRSNIVERGDLQSQKKSHIEKEEAGGCLVVIYHCQRTNEGRGIRVFCLKIFQQEIQQQGKQIIHSKAAEHCSRLDDTFFARAHQWECKFVSNKS